MSSPQRLSPRRYRASLILGLVLALVFVVIGAVVLILDLNPLFGWFFLVVGILVTAVSAVQLYRSSRS